MARDNRMAKPLKNMPHNIAQCFRNGEPWPSIPGTGRTPYPPFCRQIRRAAMRADSKIVGRPLPGWVPPPTR